VHQFQIPSFGIDNLALIEKDSAQPGPGQVLVRIHAISLNYRDLMVVQGRYNPKMKLPRVPCSDGAGEVVAVGPGVTEWKPEDRVAGTFFQNWIEGQPSAAKQKGALGGDIDGMLATEIVLPADGLVRVPEHLSYAEASTLPCAALTAWNALFTVAKTQPGDTVLIQGTGGVSIFALQFAKMAGARVIGISSSNEKLERARTLGLDAGLNYSENPDWEKWANEQTGGEGVDLAVEVGGAGTLARAIRATRVGGTIAQIGVLSGPNEGVDIRPVLSKQIKVHGVYVGSRENFVSMNKAIALANLKPAIDSTFPFREAPAALRHMENAGHFGKIVISAE
jgi:NADPH:quinone reductase-like Zn-dependent oxidoreductase